MQLNYWRAQVLNMCVQVLTAGVTPCGRLLVLETHCLRLFRIRVAHFSSAENFLDLPCMRWEI